MDISDFLNLGTVVETVILPCKDKIKYQAILPEDPSKTKSVTIPEGKVNIRAWGTKEEKILFGSAIAEDVKMNALLLSCTNLKSLGIHDPDCLAKHDKDFLIIKLRILTHTSLYGNVSFKCSSCGKMFKNNIDLSSLNVRYAGEEFKNPFYVTLPNAKMKDGKPIKVGLSLLTGYDEKFLNKFKNSSSGPSSDDVIDYRVSLHIVSLNDMIVNREDALLFYQSLQNATDSMAIRNAIKNNSYGIDKIVEVKCTHSNCQYESMVRLPYDPEFFMPESQ